jgi:hypothetical protein
MASNLLDGRRDDDARGNETIASLIRVRFLP